MSSEMATITMTEQALNYLLLAAVFSGYWATRAWDWIKVRV